MSYILAAPLTDLISLDLRSTEWSNILTYVFWAFSGAIWALTSLFAAFMAVGLIGLFERK